MYTCKKCNHEVKKWVGQCPACTAYQSLQAGTKGRRAMLDAGVPKKMKEVVHDDVHRIITGTREFDRVLGGGMVQGSIILIGGNPGKGKSTLCLQIGCELADALEDPCKVLYISGEETPSQVKQRGQRIAPEMSSLILCNETELDKIRKHILDIDPDILIIDSIQTMRAPGLEDSRPGGIVQIQESTSFITGLCKARGVTAIIVGHVNKDGDIAGPKTLEHLVDVVLNFDAERSSDIRVLSALKNRFGATSEVGVFRMTKDGLSSVDDPSAHIMRGKKAGPGSVLASVMMKAGAGAGSRSMIVEIQCLVSPSRSNSPRRVIEGYDRTRLEMCLAILGKHTDFGDIAACDIYVNLAGGFENIEQKALDLPVMLGLVSTHLNKALLPGVIAWGELGLTGEVRPEDSTDKRVSMCDAMKIKKERRLYSDDDTVITLGEALERSGLVEAAATVEVSPMVQSTALA